MKIIVCVIGVVGLSDTVGRLRTSAFEAPMRIYPPLDGHWCLYLAVVAQAGWCSLRISGARTKPMESIEAIRMLASA